jgi:hypothetical protein
MKRTLSAPTFLLATLFGLVSTSAMQAQEKKPINPIGDFEYTTTVQGQQSAGVITIFKQDDALKGKLLTDMMGEIPITSVKVEDKKVTLVTAVPDGEVVIVLNFEDDNKFSGNWSMGGQEGGAISGKRKTTN